MPAQVPMGARCRRQWECNTPAGPLLKAGRAQGNGPLFILYYNGALPDVVDWRMLPTRDAPVNVHLFSTVRCCGVTRTTRTTRQVFRDVTLNLHAEVEKMVVWFPSKNSTLTRESLPCPRSTGRSAAEWRFVGDLESSVSIDL